MRNQTSSNLNNLVQIVDGDVVFDEQSRIVYSTGACIYQILPSGIVLPKNSGDVIKTINYAREHNLSVTARGTGTSRTGAPLNSGLIIDFSRYMNQVIEVNIEESYARIQPGIVLNTLNNLIKNTGKFFAVDPSSSRFCTIGGVVANNSVGVRGVKYGSAKDNVLAMKVVLSNGELLEFDNNGIRISEIVKYQDGEEFAYQFYTKIAQAFQKYSSRIMNSTPNTVLNNDGYDVWKAVEDDNLNLLNLLVGSEGTLGIITEVKVKLHDIPKYKGVVSAAFPNLVDLDEAMREILNLGPSAVEIMDRSFIDLRREYTPDLVDWISDDADAILLMEFQEQDEALLLDKLTILANIVRERLDTENIRVTTDEIECKSQWFVRKNIQKLKNIQRQQNRAIAFVEDTAFNPLIIGKVMVEMSSILKDHNLPTIMAGHAAVGNIHIYPLLNLQTEDGVQKLDNVIKEFERLTKQYNGCISGEHGIGIVRTDSVRRLYQDSVFPLFVKIKNIFDPYNMLNPGKIISSGINVLTKNLRADYSFEQPTTQPIQYESKILKAIDGCHGCGKCLSFCPIYKHLGKQEYSPRAFINILKGIGTQKLGYKNNINSGKLNDFSGLCLNCKICLKECFDNIDVGYIISHLGESQQNQYDPSLGSMVFSNPELVGRVGSLIPNVARKILNNQQLRLQVEKIFGIDRYRRLPEFATGKLKKKVATNPILSRKRIVFFPGCYFNYYDHKTIVDEINFLKTIGHEVKLPQLSCCGIPQLVNGNREAALKSIVYNVDILSNMISEGYDIVTGCPTCALALKKEYIKLTDDLNISDRVNTIMKHSYELHEYLIKLYETGDWSPKFKALEARVAIHNPCHLRVMNLENAPLQILKMIDNVTVVNKNNSCCGMGGTWGMKLHNYALSKDISCSITEKFNRLNVDYIITSCGMCQLQFIDEAEAPIIHPIKLIKDQIIL